MVTTAAGTIGKHWRLERSERLWLAGVAGIVILLAVYPLFTDPYSLTVVRDALIFGIFALSLDYLWGKTGILSFGHAAFFGLGAYGMAITTVKLGVSGDFASLAGLAVGLGVAGLVAGGVGYFLLFGGVRGAYFTIVTLAITVIAHHIAVGWSGVTGGNAGLLGVPPLTLPWFGGGYAFFDLPFYYLVAGLATAALVLLWIACRGRYGRILAAIQDNEQRARTLGHNTSLHLLVVFIISAMLAALAGAIYVASTGFVAPDMVGLLLSTEVIVWVAIGGRGTLLGPFIGAFIVIRLQQEVSSYDTRLWPLVLGGFFIAMVFLFPDGVLSLLQRLQAAVRRLAQAGRR